MRSAFHEAADRALMATRRQLLGRATTGIGSLALASLLNQELAAGRTDGSKAAGGLTGFPEFPPKARRVIYLFQSGAPSQFELFDQKPVLARRHGDVLD